MPLNFVTAKAIIDHTHRSWSAGDVDGVLRNYTDDIWYQRNAVDFASPPFIVQGKAAMGVFLRAITEKAECMAVLESFQFHAGIARSRSSYFLRDRETSQTHASTYRQITMFRGMEISRMEQFHDAARLTAFYRLIEAEPLHDEF